MFWDTKNIYEGKVDHFQSYEGKVDDGDIVDYLKLGSGTQKIYMKGK